MKTTAKYASEIKSKWNLDLISEYTGAHNTVRFKCENSHENVATATNLLQRGYKCKECTTGHKVIPKIEWTDSKILETVQALEFKSTKDVAAKLNTTVSAINNMLAKQGITNPRERTSTLKLLEILKLQGRTLVSEFNAAKVLVNVCCSNGHTVTQQASNIIYHNTGCPKCFALEGVSKNEESLRKFITSEYKGWVEYNDRTILKGKELDIVLPDIGLAIEYNGTYWHGENKVGKTYHKDKTEAVEAFGYQLLHIKDYDWVVKRPIVESIIRSKLGNTTKIFARKCKIKQVSFPREFLEVNHIQGAGQPTSINYALFYNEELVAVATFGRPRFDKNADFELIRYCSKLNTTVVGGLSKLLKLISGRVVSYASRDYSIGNAYNKVGFTLNRVTEPGLEYYNKYEKLSRYKAQSMSKEELARYTKYYNSGNLVFYKN